MKSIGVIRKLDELGRVVIPIEFRHQLGIVEKDPIEISLEGSSIVLTKHDKNCIFCGNAKNITVFKKKPVCEDCLKKLIQL